MNRRSFIKTVFAGLAGIFLCRPVPAGEPLARTGQWVAAKKRKIAPGYYGDFIEITDAPLTINQCNEALEIVTQQAIETFLALNTEPVTFRYVFKPYSSDPRSQRITLGWKARVRSSPFWFGNKERFLGELPMMREEQYRVLKEMTAYFYPPKQPQERCTCDSCNAPALSFGMAPIGIRPCERIMERYQNR